MLAKSENKNYKPWRTPFAPANPHSAFGDYPKEYIPKTKVSSYVPNPVYEDS